MKVKIKNYDHAQDTGSYPLTRDLGMQNRMATFDINVWYYAKKSYKHNGDVVYRVYNQHDDWDYFHENELQIL